MTAIDADELAQINALNAESGAPPVAPTVGPATRRPKAAPGKDAGTVAPTDTVVSPDPVASDVVVETTTAPTVAGPTVETLPLAAFAAADDPEADEYPAPYDDRTRVRDTDMTVVKEYAEAMRAGAVFPPVVAFRDADGDLWLADGFHRLEAALAAERPTIDAEIRPGSMRDAILHALGANETHGLRRSADDRRRAVLLLLTDPEWGGWSDRKLAELARVSHPYVGDLRKGIAAVKVAAVDLADRSDRYVAKTTGMNEATLDAIRRALRVAGWEPSASLETVTSESTERIFTTKHGTPTTMRTGKIGKAKAPASVNVAAVAPSEPEPDAIEPESEPASIEPEPEPPAARNDDGKTVGQVVGYLHPIAAEKMGYVNRLLAEAVSHAGEDRIKDYVRGHAKARANLASAVADARAFVAKIEELGLLDGGGGDR